MSSSLMSCVRENSPPLELDGSATGPLSLPDARTAANMSGSGAPSTPLASSLVTSASATSVAVNGDGGGASPTAEQQKRRRFHPLRNLRRIFRRRTITNAAADTPPGSSSCSEKNLRSATLAAHHSATISASSPSSPLSHQQLQDAYLSQSLPKSKSYSTTTTTAAATTTTTTTHGGAVAGQKSPRRDALLVAGGKKQKPKQQQPSAAYGDGDSIDVVEMYTTSTSIYHHHNHHHQHHHHHQQQQQQQQQPQQLRLLQPRVGHREASTGVDAGGGLYHPRQSIGVAVLPNAVSRSFFAERQKLRSVCGDSGSQDLDSSGNDSGSNSVGAGSQPTTAHDTNATSEMSDSQRSLSEGRLVDSDYSHDPLSQSHDSVFSESATASSLSIVLKAELADVLRKRRNRPDASDEDLGLPRSPASPQRRTTKTSGGGGGGGSSVNSTLGTSSTVGNQSEVSSLSLLSMNSNDGDEVLAASTANNSVVSGAETPVVQEQRNGVAGTRYTRATNVTSVSLNADVQLRHSTGGASSSKEPKDEVDLFSGDWQRLSHSAAKHKMALRPAKKKGPSRQHRRTLENSIPEANEDFHKSSGSHSIDVVDHQDAKAKTRSLPPGVNAKTLAQHADTKKPSAAAAVAAPATAAVGNDQQRPAHVVNIKRSKTEKAPATVAPTDAGPGAVFSATNLFGFRTLSNKASTMFYESKEPIAPDGGRKEASTSTTMLETTESGFLRRLMQRNSKRTIARATAGDTDADHDTSQSEPKKLHPSNSCSETLLCASPATMTLTLDKTRSSMSYEQKIQETRNEIKREILAEGKSGLSAMLNNFMLAEKNAPPHKETTAPAREVVMRAKEARAKDSAPKDAHVKESPTKPKSGPAARQRYLPQDITPELNTLEKKRATTALSSSSSPPAAAASLSPTKETLRRHAQIESFQSTSIIREITASQSTLTSSKSDHLYEKKPKIMGLSAFQQKISRSNDSFARTSSSDCTSCTSSNSLETSGETVFINYDAHQPHSHPHHHRQRKAVEKARSFRTYTDEREPLTAAAANMPSLPDLTLNLRVPSYGDFVLGGGGAGGAGALAQERSSASPSPPVTSSPPHDKSVSLGFEINDNTLVQQTPRAESTGHLGSGHGRAAKNVIMSSSTGGGRTTSGQLLTAGTVVPSLSPTSSCNKKISEIEQNIDLIVKSPFVSVLRKSAVFGDDVVIPTTTKPAASPVAVAVVTPPAAKAAERPTAVTKVQESLAKARPKVLHLKQATTTGDAKKPSPATTPTAVPLRGKSAKVASAGKNDGGYSRNTKEPERKSAPAAPASSKAHNVGAKATRRSASVVEQTVDGGAGAVAAGAGAGAGVGVGAEVPEFMKIQLNRVDPARIAKSNVLVLSKNVKEPHTPGKEAAQSPTTKAPPKSPSKSPSPRSTSIDDLCMRRLSNESVDISEKSSPESDDEPRHSVVFEAINRQTKSLSTGSVRCSSPTSPLKKTLLTPTDATEVQLRSHSTEPTEPAPPPASVAVASAAAGNKLSLQERKRIFLGGEERSKTDKKLEELRNERKKSISDELRRKSLGKSDESSSPATPSSTEPSEQVVVMRKKSFGNALPTHANSLNGSHAISNNNNHKGADHTPELMKVFARRSLKIKDEDVQALSEKIKSTTAAHTMSGGSHAHSPATTPGSTGKKFVAAVQPTQNSVDSDKENHSSSEEKLDRLSKLEPAPHEQHQQQQQLLHTAAATPSNNSGASSNGGASSAAVHRNSFADFRSGGSVGKSGAGLMLSNNHNHNNNNGAPATNGNSVANGKVFLPALRGSGAGFRTLPIERNGSVSKPLYTATATATATTTTSTAISHGETGHANHNNNNNIHNALNSSNNNHHNANGHSYNNNNNNSVVAGKPPMDRQSVNVRHRVGQQQMETAMSTSNKTIERSATVGEFKGIHQRRAEWEQRAKEALK